MMLVSVATALERMLAEVRRIEAEVTPLEALDGRILAAPVIAGRDQPPFNAAVMDGYALRATDAPGEFIIAGESAAGAAFTLAIGIGEAVRVSTGAPLPDGANAVVAQEDANLRGDRVTLPAADAGQYVRLRGGDFRAGATLLHDGRRIDAGAIAVIAGAGIAHAAVTRRPRIAMICNGDELVAPGALVQADQIFDSASYAVSALVRGWGAEARRLPPVSDSAEAIKAAASAALLEADVLVVIGGASVGPHDHARPALKAFGADILLEGISVRPGRPTWFARLPEGRLVLGLPGNPASALVCTRLFLAAIIEKMLTGETRRATATKRATLTLPMPSNGAREAYVRAVKNDTGAEIAPILDEDSSLMTVLAQSNALVRRRAGSAAAQIGEMVEYLEWIA